MRKDVVVDGLPYPIVIAADGAATLGRLVAGTCARAVVAYDRRLEPLRERIESALQANGVAVAGCIALPGGEALKQKQAVLAVYDRLLDLGVDRRTWIVAAGGGTISDAVGFVAATYLRGVPWAVVPTTVLAMADAAIGGKTGIDLPRGKNLVGAFHDPRAVVADIASLATLPAAERGTGLAEAIKCAIIAEPALLDSIEALAIDAPGEAWVPIIAAAARVKASIVAADPRESGVRARLNLGHTIGHALESASEYRLTHGQAVAIGLRAAGIIARELGWFSAAEHARVLRAIGHAGLPIAAHDADPGAVMGALVTDKKRANGSVRFVLPYALGDVRHGIVVEEATVRAAVQRCIEEPTAAER